MWNNFTTGVPTLTNSSGSDVSFLIGTGTPTIAAIAATTPTNVAFAGPYVVVLGRIRGTAPGAPVCDRLTTYDDRTRLLLSNRFVGMDAQSRLQAGARAPEKARG